MTTPAIAYIRVSTKKQSFGDGPQRQQRAITKYAAKHDLHIKRTFTDYYTGTAIERPALAEAMLYLKRHPDTIVVIDTMDRLGRKLHVQEAILSRVWDLGATIHACSPAGPIHPDDEADPMRVAMRQMIGVFAQLDKAMLVAKMKDARQAKAARGGYAHGGVPYGKQVQDHELVDNPDEQQVIQLARTLHAQGLSLRSIGAALDTMGYRPRNGGAWHPTVVRSIITGEGRARLTTASPTR